MSVTNNQFATNTYEIVIANELTGSNNVIAGVNTAITTLGWTLHDSVDQTTYSPMVTRVYRVLNVDATTYKYAILRYDTLKLRINLSTCESWSNVSHTATNESWHSDGCFYHGYDLRQSYIIVNATERHLLLQTAILNELGHWAAIFETERVAAEDIASNTAPCFFYTNSLMMGTPFGIDAQSNRTSNTSQIMMAFPRTPDNQTDYAAAAVYAPTTSRGMWPPYIPSGNTANVGANSVYSVTGSDPNNLHLGTWWYNSGTGSVGQIGSVNPGGSIWGWDGTKIPVSSVSVDAIKKHMPFGRIYDVNVTRPIGNQLETTYFTANTNGGWIDGTGSNTEFLILPFNGGYEGYYSNVYAVATGYTYPLVTPNSGIGVSWSNNSNVIYTALTAVGNNVWAGANNGIWIWNQFSGTNSISNLVYYNSNGVYDIMFDGVRSIYGTTNVGLIQIDTETYATNIITATAMTDQGGCGYLNMDNRFIYATNRTSNTRPYCHMVYRANNTVAPNVIQMASGVALNVASGWNTPTPDYQGFVYLSNAPGTTSSQQKRMLVANVDGANSATAGFNQGVSNTTQPWYATAAHTATFEYDSIFFEPNSNRLYHFQYRGPNGSECGNVIEYANDKAFTVTSNGAAFGIFWTGTTGSMAQLAPNGVIDYRGDLNIIQHRGQFHIQHKKPSISQAVYNSQIVRIILHHPAPNPSNSNKIAGTYSATYGSGNTNYAVIGASSTDLRYASSFSYTNGIRVFNNIYNGNSEVRLQVSSGHFNLYPFGGFPTGRLLVKA